MAGMSGDDNAKPWEGALTSQLLTAVITAPVHDATKPEPEQRLELNGGTHNFLLMRPGGPGATTQV